MGRADLLPELPFARECFVCGADNPIGLRLQLWEEGELVVGEFVARREFQGFANLLQGGVLQAVLDDLMVRAVWRRHGLNVTVRMEIEFKRPVPIGSRVRVEGEVGQRQRRLVEASARALLPDGSAAAFSRGSFLLVDEERLRHLGGG